MKLKRPYISLKIRIAVAERQCRDYGLVVIRAPSVSSKIWLGSLLRALSVFLPGRLELHHRPALVNRHRKRNGEYDPPANDPDYLVYLAKPEHDIETRVRGIGAQRSDLSQRRYLKHVARNRLKQSKPKRKWPKRRMMSAINPR